MNKLRTIFLSAILLASGVRLQASAAFEISEPLSFDKSAPLNSEPIPVNPDQKLLIAFTASITGESTIEENARISVQVKKGFASLLQIDFLDDGGNKVGSTEVSILSKFPRIYGRVMYPPPGSKAVNLQIVPAKRENVKVEKLSVSNELPQKEKAGINPHPTFEFGDLCTYGYTLGYGGGVYTRPDGKTVLNSGFAGNSPIFPIRPDSYYEIDCRGIPYLGRKSSIMLQCFGEDLRKPIKSMRVQVSQQGVTTKLLIPKNVKRANFGFYYVILEELRVTESSK